MLLGFLEKRKKVQFLSRVISLRLEFLEVTYEEAPHWTLSSFSRTSPSAEGTASPLAVQSLHRAPNRASRTAPRAQPHLGPSLLTQLRTSQDDLCPWQWRSPQVCVHVCVCIHASFLGAVCWVDLLFYGKIQKPVWPQ